MTDKLTVFLMLLMFAAIGAAIVGLISPRTVRARSRPAAFFGYGFLSFVLLMAVGYLDAEYAPSTPYDAYTDSLAATVDTGSVMAADGGVTPDVADAGPTAVLRADTGQVVMSDSRTRWGPANRVAELPPGTEVRVLERAPMDTLERCRVETLFAPRVTGWVNCAHVRE